MYVCVCNAIRECELRQVAQRSDFDAEAAYSALGKRPSCGTCLDEAEAILFEEQEMAMQPAYAE